MKNSLGINLHGDGTCKIKAQHWATNAIARLAVRSAAD